jgi:hypothetical protein
MSGENANYGMCAMDFTGDGNIEIVTVKKGTDYYNLTIYNYTDETIVFEREQVISHSETVYPLNINCGNLSNPSDLKVVVSGKVQTDGGSTLVFLDIFNITSDSINTETSSEFYLLNEFDAELTFYTTIYGLVIGDLDGAGDNEIYFVGGDLYKNLLYRYNYTNNVLILDDKEIINNINWLLRNLVISNFNDSTSKNELVFSVHDSIHNKLVVFSYDNGLKLDNTINLSSIINTKTSIYSKDLNSDGYDEIIVLYGSLNNPYKATLKIYSTNSGALEVLDQEEIFIDSKNTYPVNLIVDDFDSNSGNQEIVLFLLNGNCPGGLDSYFMIYNYSNNQLNFESQRKINDINNLEFANIASYILDNFQSADLNKDNTPDLLMSGFLSTSSCSLYGTYYNSFVLFDYRSE